MDTEPRAVAGRAAAGSWGLPLMLGIFLIITGVLAFVASGLAGLASVVLLGALVAVAGVVELVFAFKNRRHGSFVLHLLSGILSLVVGVFLLRQPASGLAVLSLLLALYFFASGLFRGVTALVDRYPAWAWDLFYGITSVVLGVVVIKSWPLSALWLVGTLVGLELLTRGIAFIGVSLAIRKLLATGSAPG